MQWSRLRDDNALYRSEYFLQTDVCRLCWNRNARTELFQENADKTSGTPLLKIIKEFLEIDVLNINPNKICNNCVNELRRFYSFKKFCQKADKKLLSKLQKSLHEIKNEIVEEIIEKVEVENSSDDCGSVDSVDLKEFMNGKIIKQAKDISFKRFRNRKLPVKKPPYYCNICFLDLKSKETLSSHNNELHGIENDGKSFRCFGCDKRFKSINSRFCHEVNTCKKLKDGYKCSVCDVYLPKRSIYERHMRDHRLKKVIKLPDCTFKCKQCGLLFKSRDVLRKHGMLEHAKEKSLVCDICGRVVRKDYISRHKLIHSGEQKRYKCTHCDYKASQKSFLTLHIRTHTGERPYHCDVCPQRCISKGNLIAHKRRHNGVKAYDCTICNKQFAYKSTLAEHVAATHDRSERYTCKDCGASYNRIRNLRRHLSAKHEKQTNPRAVENIKPNIEVTEEFSDEQNSKQATENELRDSENLLVVMNQDGEVYYVLNK